MYRCAVGTKNPGRYREVADSGGSTVVNRGFNQVFVTAISIVEIEISQSQN